MNNWRKWRTPIIMVLIIAAVVVALYAIQPEICNSPSAKKLIEQGNALNCYEFWFNRYQTLVVGGISIIIAFCALWPVYKQMKISQQQFDMIRKEKYLTGIQKLNDIFPYVLHFSNVAQGTDNNLKNEIRRCIFNASSDFQTIMVTSGFIELSKVSEFRNAIEKWLTEMETGDTETIRYNFSSRWSEINSIIPRIDIKELS